MAEERKIITESEYIDLDKDDERYEFYNDEVYQMPEHSTNHTLIEINVIELLQNFLRGENALPFADNLRVYNANKIAYTYPDLIVFHEQPVFISRERLTVNNPCLVIEIIESTNSFYNSSAKFDLYQHIPSFKEHLIINADTHHVISITDRDEGWFVQEALNMNEGVHLYALNFDFSMADIYKNISMDSAVI